MNYFDSKNFKFVFFISDFKLLICGIKLARIRQIKVLSSVIFSLTLVILGNMTVLHSMVLSFFL